MNPLDFYHYVCGMLGKWLGPQSAMPGVCAYIKAGPPPGQWWCDDLSPDLILPGDALDLDLDLGAPDFIATDRGWVAQPYAAAGAVHFFRTDAPGSARTARALEAWEDERNRALFVQHLFEWNGGATHGEGE